MSNSISKAQIREAKQRSRIVGDSEGLNRAIEVALLIAPTDVSVLVTGESGVGKEAFPQIIHQNSIRKHGPYVAVNCGAIPEGTIDSELFGHKKGSFTDAVTERKGYFEVADGGTIFLDEVGELPLPTQARLLRVLESGEFMKVGSSQVQRTDIRIVAATNVNLAEAIRRGEFREDLFYRLNTVTIELPPLRDRGRDISLLFRKFAADFADKYQMPPIQLQEEAESLLLRYEWPGNIRQLRNLVERLSVIAPDREITEEVLKANLPTNAGVRHPALVQPLAHETDMGGAGREAYGTGAPNDPSMAAIYMLLRDVKGNVSELTRLLYNLLQNRPTTEMGAPLALPQTIISGAEHPTHIQTTTHSTISVHNSSNHSDANVTEVIEEMIEGDKLPTLIEMERKYIEVVLARNKGSKKKTAEDLDISERTLYRKMMRE